MIGFEILINGKPVYTIGVGDLWILTAEVMHERIQTIAGPLHERIAVGGRGLISVSSPSVDDKERHRIWPRHSVAVGDVITIRVIETNTCDFGQRLPKAPYFGHDEPPPP